MNAHKKLIEHQFFIHFIALTNQFYGKIFDKNR